MKGKFHLVVIDDSKFSKYPINISLKTDEVEGGSRRDVGGRRLTDFEGNMVEKVEDYSLFLFYLFIYFKLFSFFLILI